MSDQVNYLVGNTKGRDHLPGFTLLRSEIETYIPGATAEADKFWPVDVNLLQAMAIAWRVKKWKLTGTCSISATTTDGMSTIVANGSAAINCDVVLQAGPDGHAATHESEILSIAQGPPFNMLGNFGSNSIDGQPLSSWSTQIVGAEFPTTGVRNTGGDDTGFGITAAGATLYNPETQMFSPGVSGPDLIIGNVPIASEDFYAFAIPNRNPVTLLSGVGTANMQSPGTLTVIPRVTDNFVVPMQLTWRRTGQSPTTVFSGSGSLALTLEAMELWPYKNKAGDPVYDSVTGAMLNDPLS